MNAFEKIALALLQAAPSTVSIFVHSDKGIAILNASEILLGGILSQFGTKTTASTTPTVSAPIV